jgi:hypothetical protein
VHLGDIFPYPNALALKFLPEQKIIIEKIPNEQGGDQLRSKGSSDFT